MPRIQPLERRELPEFESVFKAMNDSLGYVPNSFFTMGRDPGILKAVGALMDAVWYPSTVTEPVRRLVTFAYSWFADSPYSAAHCACGALELGLALEKIRSIEVYEHSSAYSAAERVLLRLCHHAARIPSAVTDADFDDLRVHFTEREVVFITGLIATMAFLNKWNEIAQTALEPVPMKWASENLPHFGAMMNGRPS